MDTPASRIARSSAARARRGAVVGLAAGIVAGPLLPVLPAVASGSIPEGWSNPDPVGPGSFLVVLVGLPIVLALIIALAVYVPALLRGERLDARPTVAEDQWLGGPRPGSRELAGPDDESSQAGGAGARW